MTQQTATNAVVVKVGAIYVPNEGCDAEHLQARQVLRAWVRREKGCPCVMVKFTWLNQPTDNGQKLKQHTATQTAFLNQTPVLLS
ncbi:hypothetical protein KJ836_01305 [Patescibacteria group bacterium]|nr:hypothetical protein [Patescibacteria group bacterium]